MASRDESPRRDLAQQDLVAERHTLVLIALTAVGTACLIFAVTRWFVSWQTGLRTPWWANAAGAAAIAALYFWYRRAPGARSAPTAHAIALVATLALLVPVAYGMTSSIWWLSLVGFAMVLLGRANEAKLWGVGIPLLVVVALLLAPYVRVAGAAGEPTVEAALSKVAFVCVLIGMSLAFRRAAEQRARELHDSETEVRRLKNQFEARALTGEDLAAQRWQQLEHLNAVLRAFRGVGQLITREKEPLRLVQQAAATLVTTRGYVGAWIGLVGPDGSLSSWGDPAGAEPFAPFARRLLEGRLQARDDTAGAENPEGSRQPFVFLEDHGDRMAAIVALRHEARTYGILGVSYARDIVMDEEEKSLLAEVADDIAYALSGIEAQAEQARIAAAQRESEARFRALFEEVPVGVLLLDARGTAVAANKAWLAMVRATPDRWIGKNAFVEAAGSGMDAAELRADLERRLAGHAGLTEYTLPRADGTLATVSVRATPFPATEPPQQLLYLFDDVTERRRAEEERRQLEATLAQSDRLTSMGLLAAGVAHEINNPLSYVIYSLESLSEELPRRVRQLSELRDAVRLRLGDDGEREALGAQQEALDPAKWSDVTDRFRDALGGARRIKEIARGLGTFSRVDSDTLAPVHLRYPIESALSIASNELKYRATVDKDLAPVAPVMGNESKLSQVFLNLIINAAHAIHEGDVERNRISVRTWQEDSLVCAEVRDTGGGIPPEDRERIFEPFFTTKPVGLGSGLGLSIVRNIITGLGGTIAVASEVGTGTSFVIRLPAAQPRPRAPDVPTPSKAPATRGRILLVDDEAAVRGALRRVCAAHDVVEAESGEQARALLLAGDRRFDVVLCDMMMPNLSGMDLHRWLVAEDPDLARRVVFVTGGAFTPDAASYLEQVDNPRIEKPFSARQVLDLVAMLVGKRSE
jgi:PAS domain S-box-containing protein